MMVTVLGANGAVGQLLVKALAEQGHDVRGMVRDEEQLPRQLELGAGGVLGDLEGDIEPAIRGAEAVIFTAGSGGHTPPEKTVDVDRNGAIAAIAAADEAGVRRFVMLSAVLADRPEQGTENMQHYYRAKGDADDVLMDSGLQWTVVRPGKLTDEEGTGKVVAAHHLDRSSIPRADVAAVLAACITTSATVGAAFDLMSGQDSITDALAGLNPQS